MTSPGQNSTDRRVHARYPGLEVVRYNRAGKWYLEPRGAKRQPVTLAEAVDAAVWAAHHNGMVLWGLPGGTTFDRKVLEAL